MNRRDFIKSGLSIAAIASVSTSCTIGEHTITGTIVGQNVSAGHLFRDGKIQPAKEFEHHDIVILGGGISGLSAARRFHQNGIRNVLLLEMEEQPGGNSKWGENEISEYPFGAHYLPVPGLHQHDLLDFLKSCKIITGDLNGLPVYNEEYLVQYPSERLYIHHHWQDGVIPEYGISKKDREQIDRFIQETNRLKWLKSDNGKYVFDIPLDYSDFDSKYIELDKITFSQWLKENKYDSSYLSDYLNYGMKDDFGTTIDKISAWIGLHYFACRKGQAVNAENDDVLTWPAGNGFLAQQLLSQSPIEIRNSAMVFAIEEKDDKVLISYYDIQTQKVRGISAKYIVSALPAFIHQRLVKNYHLTQISYSPWMVAQIKVKNDLVERSGEKMSWDNVIFRSQSLGYINNCHQQLNRNHPFLNLTYYLPLVTGNLDENRQKLLQTSFESWVKIIIDDLKIVHPNIENCIQHIDIHRWGHAMIQPLPNWVSGSHRHQLKQTETQRIYPAHTDYAGISLFEEAFYQGLHAADKIIQKNSVTNSSIS